jgi:hypothetical protein
VPLNLTPESGFELKNPVLNSRIRLGALESGFEHQNPDLYKKGLWCDSKAYVRKHNDQDFNKLYGLIIKSFEEYEKKHLNIKFRVLPH